MDRFLMHVQITYPPVEDEVKVIRLVRAEEQATVLPTLDKKQTTVPERPAPMSKETVFAAREEIASLHVSDAIEQYMADLVQATRTPDLYSDDLARWIEIGVSPRASIALDKCSRTHAWLNGRDYVDPVDVRAILHDVFRHRLTLSFEADGNGLTPDHVISDIAANVALT